MNYTVVTGAAGFIGSNLVRALNERGVTNILAVDNLSRADKFANLVGCEIADYLDKRDFIDRVDAGEFDGALDAVLHQGACSDTMETDGRYMMENNYRYSLDLLDFCLAEEIPYLYASSASVYGGGRVFREAPRVRGAAERLRLLEVPVRPGGAAPAAGRVVAGRGVPLLQRVRPERSPQGAHGFGRVALLQPVPRARARSGCSRAPAATPTASSGATSSRSRTWSGSTCTSSSIPSARASSTSAPAARRPSTTSPRASINACRRGRRAAGARARRTQGAGRDPIHTVPRGAEGQVPELHPGRSRRAARRGLRASRSSPWPKAWSATSRSCCDAAQGQMRHRADIDHDIRWKTIEDTSATRRSCG